MISCGFANKISTMADNVQTEDDEPVLACQANTHEVDSMKSVAALSCLQMGLSEDLVKKATKTLDKNKGPGKYKGEEVCKIVYELEEEEDSGYLELPSNSHSTQDGPDAGGNVALSADRPDSQATNASELEEELAEGSGGIQIN